MDRVVLNHTEKRLSPVDPDRPFFVRDYEKAIAMNSIFFDPLRLGSYDGTKRLVNLAGSVVNTITDGQSVLLSPGLIMSMNLSAGFAPQGGYAAFDSAESMAQILQTVPWYKESRYKDELRPDLGRVHVITPSLLNQVQLQETQVKGKPELIAPQIVDHSGRSVDIKKTLIEVVGQHLERASSGPSTIDPKELALATVYQLALLNTYRAQQRNSVLARVRTYGGRS